VVLPCCSSTGDQTGVEVKVKGSELKRLLTNLRNLMNTHNTTDPPVALDVVNPIVGLVKPDSDKNRDSDDDELGQD
jgi:hypothetical protein